MRKSVVVIGGGVGGLSAAIYARLRGFDVLLLEGTGRLGGKAASYAVDGYRLDPGPSIIILPRIFRAVFTDAGRRPDDYLTFRRLDPVTQVRQDNGPVLNLPADRQGCIDLVADMDASDGEALDRLLGTLDEVAPLIDRSIFAGPYDRAWRLIDPRLIAFAARFDVRVTYKDLIDRRFRSPLLRAFFYGFPSYGGQTYDRPAPGALMIPHLMLSEGVHYPKGGVGSIPSSLVRLAGELGVEIRERSPVTGLKTHRRRVVAARLETGEEIAGESFISNVDRSTTRAWLGHAETAPPSLSYFTVYLGLRRQIGDLAHHVLCIPETFAQGFEELYRRREFPADPIIYVNVPSVTDPSVAPLGCTGLFAVVTTPAEAPTVDWDRDERMYRTRVVESLRRFGLTFEESEVEVERIQTPSRFARAHGNYRGSLYGVDERHRMFGGLMPHGNRDREYGNLFYCGGSVQPGAGLPMVTLSGKFAAELI